MLEEFDSQRYSKVTRNRALEILNRANIVPAKFTAHRDRSFTARYRRKSALKPESYEMRLEHVADHPVAIFKRPNKALDRGPYVTLKFAFADQPDWTPPHAAVKASSNGTVEHIPMQFELLALLGDIARDIRQLADEAENMLDEHARREHLRVIIEELQRQSGDLAGVVEQLAVTDTGTDDDDDDDAG